MVLADRHFRRSQNQSRLHGPFKEVMLSTVSGDDARQSEAAAYRSMTCRSLPRSCSEHPLARRADRSMPGTAVASGLGRQCARPLAERAGSAATCAKLRRPLQACAFNDQANHCSW